MVILEAPPVMSPTEVREPVTSAEPLKLCPQMFREFWRVVAVVAFPLNAPVKVVVVRLLVLGLKLKPVPRFTVWVELLELATNKGKKLALVLVLVVATFPSPVLVPETVALLEMVRVLPEAVKSRVPELELTVKVRPALLTPVPP
jgi:hypothetical protein